jgi:hypothetical protein
LGKKKIKKKKKKMQKQKHPRIDRNSAEYQAVMQRINAVSSSYPPVDELPWTFPNNTPPGTLDVFRDGPPSVNIPIDFSMDVKHFRVDDIPVPEYVPLPASEKKKVEKVEKKEENGEDFEIVVSAMDGDCLFDSVRQAMASEGSSVTVTMLREVVAREVIQETPKAMETLKNWKMIYKEARKSLEDAQKIEDDPKKRKREIDDAEFLLKEFGHVSPIADSEEETISESDKKKMYQVMRTKGYWGEAFALGVLENLLKFKFLIMDGDSSKAQTGEDHGEDFEPTHFLILVLRGMHYQPVKVKTADGSWKFLLQEDEIPEMVVNKFKADLPNALRWYLNLDLTKRMNKSAIALQREKARKFTPRIVKSSPPTKIVHNQSSLRKLLEEDVPVPDFF